MKLNEAYNLVNEEIKEDGKRNCLLLDIDDSILTADPSVIGIWKNKPGEKPVRLTPDEFAKDPDAEHEEWYDYKEFRDPEKVYQSIVRGTPILRNLRLMDAHVRANWDIGFLTARGLQDVVDSALRAFLKTRTKDGKLIPIGGKLKKDISAGVNDASWDGIPAKTPERKAMVLKDICNKYDKVKFVDDDIKNINFVKSLKLPNLTVIKAQE